MTSIRPEDGGEYHIGYRWLIVADEGLELCEEGVLKLCVGSPVVAEFQHQADTVVDIQ